MKLLKNWKVKFSILSLIVIGALVLTACSPEVESISVDVDNAKVEYVVDEVFSTDGIVVTASLSDDSEEEVALADVTFTAPDMTTAGEKTVTVSYLEKTATFTISVEEAGPTVLFTFVNNNYSYEVYSDGTGIFRFSTYSIEEVGTWTWQNWTFTVISPNGVEVVATINQDNGNALEFDYTADINSQLVASFSLGSSVEGGWGIAFAGQGSYDPS